MPKPGPTAQVDESRVQKAFLLAVGLSLAFVLVGILAGLDFGVRAILHEAESGILPGFGGSAGLAESVRRLVVGMGFVAVFDFSSLSASPPPSITASGPASKKSGNATRAAPCSTPSPACSTRSA